jgi:hypothetical protein
MKTFFFAILTLAAVGSFAGCVAPRNGGQRSAASAQAEPECRMGSDGRQACGYDCRIGSDGVAACANTPDGTCAMGSDGRVVCSQVVTAQQSAEPRECKLGSDGSQTCGYNCRFGSNGRWYCASTPNGRCAMNSNGTFSCS